MTMANESINFKYQIMTCSADSNCKSKHDEVINEHTSWKKCVDELKEINRGITRGMAYVKFVKIYGY